MILPFVSEPRHRVRDAARRLVERTGISEDSLVGLVAAADTETRRAEAELSDALDLTSSSVDQLCDTLRSQVHRSVYSAQAARLLLADAREQHLAAARLLSHVDSDRTGEAPRAGSDRHSVLVVDDYHEVRELVAEVLTRAGFVVRTAANGLEGLIAAYEMRPAVIVMDLTMPVLDGLEATRLIKATAATRHARVIAYTGNPVSKNHVGTLFAAVLEKPATPDAVVAKVQHVASLN